MRIIAIVIIALPIIGMIISHINNKKLQREKEEIRQKEKEIRREEEEKRIQAEKIILEQRVKEYGCLTKRISISTFSGKENDIFVYEESKTIFIMGKKYMFNDILSCNIERQLYAKGRTTHITTPDKGEMATQEFLYGMGKKYNVKTTTTVVSSPDTYKYIVYIGVNSISSPQIKIASFSSKIANEINNLMNVIINNNTKS